MAIAPRTGHPRVAAWLSNLPPNRQEAGALLVDGLRLVSETDLRRDLGDLVERLLGQLPGPVAAFPAREVPSGESAHPTGRDAGYDVFQPGLPGSEAVVGNVLTGVLRQPAARGQLLPDHGLAPLRAAKVRTILLVDDFSGSGKRLVDFATALRRHATVRSWASAGLIEFHVAVFAATARALRLLHRRFGEDRVHLVLAAPTFAGAGWTAEQLADVEAMCLAQAGRRRKAMALGFKESRALIAFEHTAPNNLPFVLWKVADGWNSLFEGKAVPRDLLSLFAMTPAPPREPLAGTAGAERLGRVIDLLGHRVRRPDRIAEVTDTTPAEVARLLALAQTLGLAGSTLRLTDAGLVELRRWRSEYAPRELRDHDEPYYPSQLRAER
ncbi:hypothetical protein ASG29_06600 [Sphingomonas sp. Leaf412]|uniref:phosphoribosyltransferase-like protein n=1 Tax=Sphingomonas sp. Leaf412 TaxID=1736370 RepID=UPI0006F89502|nr:hypothetical protein [Sphingomonas sp. Leaf412]KQT33676.1 hypothetical protein ASG29_06600 [Sphingomonas sp. Leaf412]